MLANEDTLKCVCISEHTHTHTPLTSETIQTIKVEIHRHDVLGILLAATPAVGSWLLLSGETSLSFLDSSSATLKVSGTATVSSGKAPETPSSGWAAARAHTLHEDR